MGNPLNHPAVTHAGLLLARVPLGAYFLLAGYSKIFNTHVGPFVAKNLDNAMRFMPESLARTYLTAVPFVEVTVGLLLIIGLFTRLAAAVTALSLLNFTIATGLQFMPRSGPPFNSNLILLGTALLLMVLGPGRVSIDHAMIDRTRPPKRS